MESGSLPACPPGGARPTRRGARLAGRGSSPEVLPEIKTQPRVSDPPPGACSFFALRFLNRACRGRDVGGLSLGLGSSRPPASEGSKSILAEGRTSPGRPLLMLGTQGESPGLSRCQLGTLTEAQCSRQTISTQSEPRTLAVGLQERETLKTPRTPPGWRSPTFILSLLP